jgi:hypothetical protein
VAAWHESRVAHASRRARRRWTILARVLGYTYGLALAGLAVLIAYKLAR